MDYAGPRSAAPSFCSRSALRRLRSDNTSSLASSGHGSRRLSAVRSPLRSASTRSVRSRATARRGNAEVRDYLAGTVFRRRPALAAVSAPLAPAAVAPAPGRRCARTPAQAPNAGTAATSKAPPVGCQVVQSGRSAPPPLTTQVPPRRTGDSHSTGRRRPDHPAQDRNSHTLMWRTGGASPPSSTHTVKRPKTGETCVIYDADGEYQKN